MLRAGPVNMAAELSRDLEALLQLLPEGWQLQRLGPGRVRWGADLSFGDRRFHLVCDRGYIEVSEMVDGESVWLEPPGDQKLQISPVQLAELLQARVT